MMTKQDFENGFQQWCNDRFNEPDTELGKCDCSQICNWCRPFTETACSDALNEWLSAKGKELDYESVTYEDVWRGNI